MNIQPDLIVVDRAAHHRDRLEAIELMAGILGFRPAQELLPGHQRLAADDGHKPDDSRFRRMVDSSGRPGAYIADADLADGVAWKRDYSKE